MSKPAIETQGTRFYRADPDDTTSPLTYAEVGKVVSFEGPGGKASEIDATTLTSDAKEFLIGLPDEGTLTLEINLDTDDLQQRAMRQDRRDRALRSFKLALTDELNTELLFDAYVMEFRLTGRADGIVKASVSLRISGPVVESYDEE